jgi:MOSC domain-containing protein YiiM
MTEGSVIAVSCASAHAFTKKNQLSVRLLPGLGVEGDAHSGVTVRHRSRVARDPTQLNLRQVHLIHAELFTGLTARGFKVRPGELGENITTQGVDLLSLPVATRLRIGSTAMVEITGLRNPCSQIDRFQKGLMSAVLDRDEAGRLVRKAGVMSIVLMGGDIFVGDAIRVELPAKPHRRLEPV